MNERYIGAMILAPLLLFIFLGGYFLKISVVLLSLGGMYEFYKVSKVDGYKPISIVGYLLCLVYYMYLGRDFNLSCCRYIYFGGIFLNDSTSV